MANVTLENISRRYGATTAVEDVSLTLESGQFLTLLGPSGCGKSTTLRMIAGLLAPTTGRILLDGKDVTALGPAKRNIGMVFQSLALFPHMTAAENVAFGLNMRKVSEKERNARVKKILDVVQLGHLADRYPSQLSGGQQQRVAIARAMVIQPSILILDEPFAALDRKLREAMQVELRQITKSLGITSLFVTHDQEEALMMSDYIAVMGHSRVQQFGTPSDIYQRPANRFVADFVGMSNVLDGHIVAANKDDAFATVEALGIQFKTLHAEGRRAGAKVSVALRPEGVTVESVPVKDAAQGKVRSMTYHGHMSSYAIELDNGQLVHAREINPETQMERPRRFEVGAPVWVNWQADAVRVLER